MTKLDKIIKRVFDFCLALIGLILTGWILIIAIIIARYDTKLSGLFFQTRVGQYGKLFKVFKLRSMKDVAGVTTTVSTDFDPRITKIGKIWRKTKIDELPQLFNVLIGQMSFVGPRPDVPGFADELKEEDAIILTVKPGITGPASIFFKNEEEILSKQANPEEYNRNVIWPQKVELNKSYIKNFSVIKDIKYILKTIF